MTDIVKTWRICPYCGEDGLMAISSGEPPSIQYVSCTHCDGTHKLQVGINELAETLFHTYEIVNATDTSEYNGLSDANQGAYNMIISCGVIDLAEGTSIRDKLWNIFGEGTTTRTNLEALVG